MLLLISLHFLCHILQTFASHGMPRTCVRKRICARRGEECVLAIDTAYDDDDASWEKGRRTERRVK